MVRWVAIVWHFPCEACKLALNLQELTSPYVTRNLHLSNATFESLSNHVSCCNMVTFYSRIKCWIYIDASAISEFTL